MKIKICGITHPDTALFAAQKGADFIGIVLSKESKRYVDLELAAEIVAAARRGGAQPVLVFAENDIENIEMCCRRLNVDLVQSHHPDLVLPDTINRFYVCRAHAYPANLNQIILREDQDYVLFDSLKPGSGICFEWDEFSPPHGMPWFLAGGLNPKNVRKAILKLKPFGVDVSSGVEKKGQKDHAMIEEFIREALRL